MNYNKMILPSQKKIIQTALMLVLTTCFLPQTSLALFINDPAAKQHAFADVHVYEAWEQTTGNGQVVVAIIDNGFDSSHPDLIDNVWKNVNEIPDNGIDDDTNGYIDDVWGWNFVPFDVNNDKKIDQKERKGSNDPRPKAATFSDDQKKSGIINHGTLVAGIIGAKGGNGKDGAGVNWNVRLMNLRVANNDGTGNLLEVDKAIRYAVDNGADVINISLVGKPDNMALSESLLYAYQKGVVVVAAAGNDGQWLNRDPVFPICADASRQAPIVLGVSGIDQSRRLASFSNYGSSCIDITAPATHIMSTMQFAPQDGLHVTYGGDWNGTSFAAPFVSGAAALVKSVRPEWGPDLIYQALLTTTHKTPTDNEDAYQNLFGAGLLQVDKAVAYAFSHPTSSVSIPPTIPSIGVTPPANTPITNKIVAVSGTDVYTKEFQNVGMLQHIDALSGQLTDAVVVPDQGVLVSRMVSVGKTELSLYNKQWELEQRWSIPTLGEVNIDVGAVWGEEIPRIIVSDQGATGVVASVYTVDGQLLNQIFDTNVGKEKSVSTIRTINGENIVYTYAKKGVVHLKQITGDGIVISDIRVKELSVLPEVATGDLNGDGVDEIVLAAGAKDGSKVLFLTNEGTQIRQLTPSIENSAGYEMLVYDVSADKHAELIIVPNNGTEPIRIWSADARLLDEWTPFNEPLKKPIILLNL